MTESEPMFPSIFEPSFEVHKTTGKGGVIGEIGADNKKYLLFLIFGFTILSRCGKYTIDDTSLDGP